MVCSLSYFMPYRSGASLRIMLTSSVFFLDSPHVLFNPTGHPDAQVHDFRDILGIILLHFVDAVK
jgi:hypothetical protein